MATRKTPNTDTPDTTGAEAQSASNEGEAPKPGPRKRGPKPKTPASSESMASDTEQAKPAPARRGPAKRAPNADTARKPAGRGGRKPAPPASPVVAAGRKFALPLGGLALAAGAGLVAFLTRGRIAALIDSAVTAATPAKPSEGHVPTDLLDPNRNADDRAVADFRPNMDAPMTAGEREALAPATGPSPSLVSGRGEMNMQTGPGPSE